LVALVVAVDVLDVVEALEADAFVGAGPLSLVVDAFFFGALALVAGAFTFEAGFFVAGVAFSFAASWRILGASLTLPEGPLGSTKTPFSFPDVIARLS